MTNKELDLAWNFINNTDRNVFLTGNAGTGKTTDLISENHYKELKEIIPKYKFDNLSDLKHQIDNKYTYGELRLVLDDISKK